VKNYYISTRAVWAKHFRGMHSAFIDLGGGAIVLCAEFKSAEHQDAFEAEAGTAALPYMVAAPTGVVGAQVAAQLSTFGVLSTHSTFAAAMLLRKVHSGFDPRHSF
jgi:hypothetical protein